MRYYFKFSTPNTGELKEEMEAQNVRDIDMSSRILLSSFFPELFTYKTYYRLLEKEVEKGKITFTLTKEYKHGTDC